jgi:flagellar motor switch protein FliN/FliY
VNGNSNASGGGHKEDLLRALGGALGDGGALNGLGAHRTLDFLLDVPLMVTVELGRKKIPIQELLQLGKGAVLELDKIAGEPLDVRVNDRLIARGEAVVVNDKFGVRLTQIVSQPDRIGQLA